MFGLEPFDPQMTGPKLVGQTYASAFNGGMPTAGGNPLLAAMQSQGMPAGPPPGDLLRRQMDLLSRSQ